MNLYIDYRNLLNLFSLRKLERDGDIVRLLKNELEIHALFPVSRFKEDNINYDYCIRIVEEWRIKFDDDEIPVKPLRNFFLDKSISFAERRNRLCSVYLLDIEDKEDKTMIEYLKQYVLIDRLGNETKLLRLLYNDNNQHLITQHRINSVGCNSWRELTRKMTLPATDVLIHDRYLLKSMSNSQNCTEKNLSLPVLNIIDLIGIWGTQKGISINAEEPMPLNLVIFTLSDEKLNLEKQYTRFANAIKLKYRNRAFNLTFVLYNERGSFRQCHDRFILTNYKRFDSGDSFHNLFNINSSVSSKGGVASVRNTSSGDFDNRSIFVSSIATKNYKEELIEEPLQILQESYNRIEKHYPDHIIGDRQSNLIEF